MPSDAASWRSRNPLRVAEYHCRLGCFDRQAGQLEYLGNLAHIRGNTVGAWQQWSEASYLFASIGKPHMEKNRKKLLDNVTELPAAKQT